MLFIPVRAVTWNAISWHALLSYEVAAHPMHLAPIHSTPAARFAATFLRNASLPRHQKRHASALCGVLASHAANSPAIVDSFHTLTYADLITRASALRHALPFPSASPSPRVAILLPPQSAFPIALLAAWAAGAIAVPLSPLYPPAALAPLLDLAAPAVTITDASTVSSLPASTPGRVMLIDDFPYAPATAAATHTDLGASLAAACAPATDAMIMFTSGTTGAAKGVVWTHGMLQYQMRTLSAAWRWQASDRALNVLPLHHIHGLVNVVLCALHNGACLEMHPEFRADRVWEAFGREGSEKPSVFMAVPAVYRKLIAHYEKHADIWMQRAAREVRLFVCGSAALPRKDFEAWKRISGQKVLERYGMTETGMTLSNNYDERRQGSLGVPLPGVETAVGQGKDDTGTLLVRGPGVFSKYWQRPDATQNAFKEDGWFDTGDVVEKDSESGSFKMLGRASADIIKTGGYKVSAIEIEEVLRECEGITDCCVVGITDEVLGERIVAALISPQGSVAIEKAREWAGMRLPKYRVPREFLLVNDFPRNVLGKVQKKAFRDSLEQSNPVAEFAQK